MPSSKSDGAPDQRTRRRRGDSGGGQGKCSSQTKDATEGLSKPTTQTKGFSAPDGNWLPRFARYQQPAFSLGFSFLSENMPWSESGDLCEHMRHARRS